MNLEPQPPNRTEPADRKWLRRFWALLPSLFVLCMIVVIVLLFDQIKLEGETIKARKAADLATRQPPVNVVVQKLVPAPISQRISLPGVVTPWVNLRVLAEVRGKVMQKPVEEGQTVKRGDLLAVLDQRDYHNAHASVKAAYETAAAALKRLEALFTDQLATQSQIDEAVARMHAQKAAMDNAALNLERCEIRAAIDGTVNRIFFENGQFLNSGDPVADILQIDRVKVRVGIPESDVDAVRRLTWFDLTVDALDGKRFRGRRDHLSRTADNQARLYSLYLELDNARNELLPDMFARVEIVKRRVDDGLGIPLYALINRNGGHSVFVVQDGRAASRPVEIGLQDGWRVQVARGLEPGMEVIVVGQRNVNDGQSVQVVRQVSDLEELDQ